jgi:phosphatidylethanolamine-binding protein (PEBP) family uncharacterized protein
MLVRRLPTIALLACLPILLVNCSSDNTGSTGGAGSSSTAGKAGSVGTAGQPAVAGGGAGGSVSVGGGGSTSVGGGGSTSVGGGGSTSVGGGGTSAGGSGGVAGTSGGSSAGAAGKAGGGTGGGSTGGSFTLTSPNHMEGAKFDGKYTCNGGSLGAGVIPELDWSGVPSGAMSFAITFIDTTIGDTKPMGQHWAMWNIPATVMKIPEGTKMLMGDLMTAKQSGNFLSPCAQSLMNGADDQYEFTVWAIPTATLNVSGTSVANVLTALKALSPKPPTATLHGHSGLKGQ